MREIITISVGQCGNQIGSRFWDLALREHAKQNKEGNFDDSLSTFFRNVDCRYEDPQEIPVGSGKEKIKTLKARAVLVDMEEGVVNQIIKSPIGELFDNKQFVTDVSGAGNNWACGHHMYGNMYGEKIMEKVRRAAEFCDSLQSFFIMHSLGGGTGSGLGTKILQLLADNFPEVYKFDSAVFPSEDDDVVMSPYNSVLALNQLTEHADCVLPIDNQSLIDIILKINNDAKVKGKNVDEESKITSEKGKKQKAFDSMNNIAANLLTSLTASMRFEGSLNVDLNEITTNLVPFPRLHYLMSSLSPLSLSKDVNKRLIPRSVDQMFTDSFHKDYQLMKADPRRGTYLACGLFLRGAIEISDINRNIDRMKKEIKMIHWNPEGFKIGICSVPPLGQPYSLLSLSNNCCIRNTFSSFRDKFNVLYKRKVYTHHFTEYMEMSEFDESLESLSNLISSYNDLETAVPKESKRYQPEV